MTHKVHSIGIILFILVIGLLAIRIPYGIDFGDEAYYAFFVSDWLISSIAKSTLITLHQTAALIVYPAIALFHLITHSTDGIFLFLRFLFLLENISAAIFWMLFLRRLGYGVGMWLGGLFIVSFIPFGLPAPSYNSLGSQAIVIALATLGCAALSPPLVRKNWLATSALCWTIATIAYPPLIIGVIFLSLLGLLSPSEKSFSPRLYIIFLAVLLLVGWTSVMYALSFEKVYASIKFLSAVNEPFNFTHKLHYIFSLLIENKFFSALCLFSMILGLLRKQLNTTLVMLSMSAILISLFFIPPALFARSHDAITLLTFMGLGLVFDLRKKAAHPAHIIAIIYTTSLVTGCITGVTAFHSILNFCIGALPAACLAVLPDQTTPTSKFNLINLLPGIIAIFVLLSTSLFSYYGETPSTQQRKQITGGFFSGIKAHEDDIILLDLVKEKIKPLVKNDSIAIFSRSPGILLGLPSSIKMPFVYPLIPIVNAKGVTATHSFYENASNQPAFVIVYRDIYFTPLNPMQPDFAKWYTPVSTIKSPIGNIEIYQHI